MYIDKELEMKKIIIAATALVAFISCQETIITDKEDGAISVYIDASAAVQVVTKGDAATGEGAGEDATDQQLTADDFAVYVKSVDYVVQKYDKYSMMPDKITVPAGEYVVSAENISIADSFKSEEDPADPWGQVRYAGQSGKLDVKPGPDPTPCSFTCTMANTALSIDFSDNLKYHFTDIKVSVSNATSRSLEYTAQTTDKVGYFTPETITYIFSGKYMDETAPMQIVGTKELSAATHLHLTFTINEQVGNLGKPVINVVADCQDLNKTITVDPSEGGSFSEEDVTE